MPFEHDARRPTGDSRKLTYDPDEHDKGDWFREQITDDEWNDYEWVEVGDSATRRRSMSAGPGCDHSEVDARAALNPDEDHLQDYLSQREDLHRPG